MVTFMFGASLQLMLFMRSEIRALQGGIPETVATALAQSLGQPWTARCCALRSVHNLWPPLSY
jgi:hypothetical protein